MAVTLDEALTMLAEPKWLIAHGLEWASDKDRNQKANFVWKLKCRARTVATMPRGLWFRIETWIAHPSKAVFQLECDYPSTRSHLVLYRLEMEPFGTHQNIGWGPDHLSGLFIDEGITHEHSFLHYQGMTSVPLRAGVDPMAAVTLNPPKNFDDALRHVCVRICIENRSDIPPVPSQTRLI